MFHSTAFWYVLIAAVLLHWLMGARARPWCLAIVGFAYLAVLDLQSTLAATGLTLAVYWAAPRAGDQRTWRGRSASVLLVAVFGWLVYAKYVPRLWAILARETSVPEALIPLGISYYTFKLAHYVIEAARGTLPPHRLGDFLAYILLFPTFPAGPIERFDHFVDQRAAGWSWELPLEGITRIIHGLVKRFALMDAILIPLAGAGAGIDELAGRLDQTTTPEIWWILALKYLIAYMDFSAYSDLAIGSARLFGYRIMENFDFPIIATSIGEFWRRWHMTLAGWCQGYVYMPLLVWSRNPYLAAYASFLTMGIWHAATWHWVAWGLYHASGVVLQQAFTRWSRNWRTETPLSEGRPARRLLGWVLTFAFVSSSYAITAGYPDANMADSARVLLKAWTGFAG